MQDMKKMMSMKGESREIKRDWFPVVNVKAYLLQARGAFRK